MLCISEPRDFICALVYLSKSIMTVVLPKWQEYVVLDREACKDVPELGASHVSELRMLGLC
jgi:hypothetical protein